MKRYRSALLTAATVAALAALHVGLILAAQRVTLPLGPTSPSGNSRLSIWILLYLSICVAIAFVSYVYAGYDDDHRDLLFWPITVVKGALSLYLSMIAASGIDLLLHGTTTPPHWRFFDDPTVRLYAVLLLAVVGTAMLWMGWLLLYNRWKSPYKVATFFLAIAAVIVACGLVLVVLSHGGNI